MREMNEQLFLASVHLPGMRFQELTRGGESVMDHWMASL